MSSEIRFHSTCHEEHRQFTIEPGNTETFGGPRLGEQLRVACSADGSLTKVVIEKIELPGLLSRLRGNRFSQTREINSLFLIEGMGVTYDSPCVLVNCTPGDVVVSIRHSGMTID